MAISRGAGTEIIRTIHFDYDASNTTDQQLIIGVQHHIYTVLSVICYADQTQTNSNDVPKYHMNTHIYICIDM